MKLIFDLKNRINLEVHNQKNYCQEFNSCFKMENRKPSTISTSTLLTAFEKDNPYIDQSRSYTQDTRQKV
jgi:hypothetical protein